MWACVLKSPIFNSMHVRGVLLSSYFYWFADIAFFCLSNAFYYIAFTIASTWLYKDKHLPKCWSLLTQKSCLSSDKLIPASWGIKLLFFFFFFDIRAKEEEVKGHFRQYKH